MRLDSISFFIMLLLLSAAGVWGLWNLLARDVPRLPAIRYRTALAATVLWGLLFIVVLTMISGARELLTPGAWKKTGYTYTLQETEKAQTSSEQQPDTTLMTERRARLELLRLMLWAAAAGHEGKFPASIAESGVANELWQQPGVTNVMYGYHGGKQVGGEIEPLVYEFDVYGEGESLILDTSGMIRATNEIAKTPAPPGGRP
ncbi:hypothetical protein [Planctomicrobium piriforme]|nr:hypothetical protein [Planctomicrobium piriforme]